MVKLEEIRDEIISCFLEVQKEFIEEAVGNKDKREFVISFLKKAFEKTKGDYNNPTKESISKAVQWLVDTAPPPNNVEEAEKHRQRIFDLINSL